MAAATYRGGMKAQVCDLLSLFDLLTAPSIKYINVSGRIKPDQGLTQTSESPDHLEVSRYFKSQICTPGVQENIDKVKYCDISVLQYCIDILQHCIDILY